MAEVDTQRQFLTLIRGFATEKSQGERRVTDLKKKTEDLRSESDLTNAELEKVKRCKEMAEQELKGCEVELAMNEASIQAHEARISSTREVISKIASEVEAFKTEESFQRDAFLGEMFELNKTIRNVQGAFAGIFQQDTFVRSSSDSGEMVQNKQAVPDNEIALKDLGDKLEVISSQIHREEQEYQENLNNHKKVQQELAGLEMKASVLEAVRKETKVLHELTRQTATLEETCSSIGEELKRKCECPSCHFDNMGALGGAMEENQ